ncbi:MAG: cysteine peptidase family C39 domain-containing protein, partial [Bacteroidota bacterium]
MAAKYYGKSYSLPFLREKCYIDRAGVSLKGISEAAELIGFRTLAVKIPLSAGSDLPSLYEAPLPAILHWNQNHFVTLFRINKKYAWIADPADGKHKVPLDLLKKSWFSDGEQGIALLLEPTPNFYKPESSEDNKKGFSFLYQYLTPHRRLMTQLILGLLLGTVFQLIFPFLTQSLVDVGIETMIFSISQAEPCAC